MSSLNKNNNNNTNINIVNNKLNSTNFDPSVSSKHFCDFYYSSIQNDGFVNVSDLFSVSVNCNYNGNNVGGFHNFVIKIASEGVSKFNYDKINAHTSVLSPDTLLVTVTGILSGVTFWGTSTNVTTFSETFILQYKENDIKINNHIFTIL
jgi:hypothetical protein